DFIQTAPAPGIRARQRGSPPRRERGRSRPGGGRALPRADKGVAPPPALRGQPRAEPVATPARMHAPGTARLLYCKVSRRLPSRMSERFELVSPYAPAGDQPYAIEKLVEGFEAGLAKQVLLGVTGSGKTYTIANVVQQVQKPTLVMAHNKTLAAQLYGEFKAFFPNNAVEYFVSYYDYYQPEAYVPSTDTFIEKDSSINDHIEQMRLAATKALLSRRD